MAEPVRSSPGAQEVLAGLGARMGIPGLRLDADSSCQLVFDQRWVVTLVFAAARSRWLLSCPLAERHGAITPGSQVAMLRANFLGSGSGGGWLAVAPDGRPFLHMQVSQSEASETVLLDVVESLLNQAERWTERLHVGESAPSCPDPARGGNEPASFAGGDRPPAWMFDRA